MAGRDELGFGITARSRPGLKRLGRRIEALGYAELWANDTRAGSGLATLADCASGTQRLILGLGVAGLSERTAEALADEVERLGLPRDRLVMGVGSGASHSLKLVREGVASLRRRLSGTPIAVAAVGPRMCALAGELADVVLCNWASPERLAWNRERVAEGAAAADRQPPDLAAYVRVAIGADADQRLQAEAQRYLGRRSAYRPGRAERAGAPAPTLGEAERIPGGVAVAGPEALPTALTPYRAVLDRTILRALPENDQVEGWLAVAEAASIAIGTGLRA